MRSISNGSIPMFLGELGINPNVVGPQIKDFDVFYIDPLIVGFHVTGASEETIAHFFVGTKEEPILFFNVYQPETLPEPHPVLFFNVSEREPDPLLSFFNVAEQVELIEDPILFFNVAEMDPCEA